VTLLEREPAPRVMARPEILWGATPTALDRFGIGDLIRTQASVRLSGVEIRHGKQRLLALDRRVFYAAGVEAYSTEPGVTRAIIADAALATGQVCVVRGVEVTEVLRENGEIMGVQGNRQGEPLQVCAKLVVGDDGAHSIVRSALAAPLKTKIFPLDFITTLIEWPEALPPDQARVWLNPAAFRRGIPALGLIPWPGGRGVALLPLAHARVEPLFRSEPSEFWSGLAELTPLAEAIAFRRRFPDDFTHVRRPYGHAPQYVARGAAILGDAAHPVSPAGGQGANASIWDALALAEVAHEALAAGDLGRQRLSRYEALRRRRNAASVRITRGAAGGFQLLSHLPGLPRLVPALLRAIDSLPWLKGKILSTAATTFVT
jgi:2-polyprenyl-6-methoxyphenol hydroxylase-like FAD-dependent oxidoreductase